VFVNVVSRKKFIKLRILSNDDDNGGGGGVLKRQL